ncbi:MAG: dockerin type I repeat-containing protein [Alistipes senegalensis]|nr:dockerin type I repeat-containing protein [Alistipes senegalensis]
MNKKLKKMLATISAIAMCAVSVPTISASAVPVNLIGRVNEYTTSFTVDDYEHGEIKYSFWQAGTDFLGREHDRVFISEPIKDIDYETGEEKIYSRTILYHQYYTGVYTYDEVVPFRRADSFNFFSAEKGGVNDGKIELIAEYLSENSIPYTINEYTNRTNITFDNENMNFDETAELATEIRKYVNWSFDDMVLPDFADIIITDIENTLPEPTLLGDANEDGTVTIADAVLIMQALSNPDDFQLTPQGAANADIVGDGDGVTVADALRIQEMEINM